MAWSIEIIEDAALGAAWRDVPRLSIGEGRDVVTIARDDARWLVLEGVGAAAPFRDAIAWCDRVVVGFGAWVCVVDPIARSVVGVALSGYFGHLYPIDERILVADAERLRCVDRDGAVVWTSDELAIDGVLVHEIDGDAIIGEGEHDPPGGWRPFRVELSTGRALRVD